MEREKEIDRENHIPRNLEANRNNIKAGKNLSLDNRMRGGGTELCENTTVLLFFVSILVLLDLLNYALILL